MSAVSNFDVKEPAQEEQKTWHIKLVPVSILSTPIALFGLGLAWKKVAKMYEFAKGWEHLSTALICLGTFCLCIVLFIYFMKFLRAKEKVLEEWKDVQKFHLFGNITLSIVWFSLFFNEFDGTKEQLAPTIWHIGAVTHLLFSLLTIRCWMHTKVDLAKITPLYFFPFMTNFIPAMIGPLIENTSNELAWFSFSIAILFYGVLFVIYVLVIITTAVFPVRSSDDTPTPTTSILAPNSGLLTWLIIPFCIGSISYANITKQYDYFAMFLYFGGIFNAFVCIVCADELANNGNPFTIGWHSSTFPLVGLVSSTLDFYHYRYFVLGKENESVKTVANIGIWLVSAYVAGVWMTTLVQIARKKMFVEPPKPTAPVVTPISEWLAKKSS